MAKHLREKARARLEAARRRLGVTSGANPFDLRSGRSRSHGGKGERDEKGGEDGVLDQRVTLRPGEKGYSHARTVAAREMLDRTPRSFASPRDAYADVRARSKQHRLEEQQQSRDIRDRVEALDARTADLGLRKRLPQAASVVSAASIASDFQPIPGRTVPAHRGSTTVADAIRVGAERLKALDRDASSPHRRRGPRTDGDDAENLYGNLAFSAGDSESDSDSGCSNESSCSNKSGCCSDESCSSDESGGSDRPEAPRTALSRLAFVLNVPDDQQAFMALLDDVACTDEILVLDRLIKSNSTLLTEANRPAMDRLAGFCVRRLEELLFVREDIDLARLDSLARALRHITTEVPRTLLGLYQGVIMRLHGRLKLVNYLVTSESSEPSATPFRLQALEDIVPQAPYVLGERWGRSLFGAVVLGRLLAIVFPQGSFHGADPSLGLPSFREQPLISAFFLAVDSTLQGLVLRVRTGCCGAPSAELLRDALCLQALLSVVAGLASSVQLFFPSLVTGLQAALEGLGAFLAAAVPGPLLADASARFPALPVPAEHRIDLAETFLGSPALTLGNVLAGLASTLNTALLASLFVSPLATGGLCAALPAWLLDGGDEDEREDDAFTLGWCARRLRLQLQDDGPSALAAPPDWARRRPREIETHAPLFREDFAPGKTMDANAARERERRLQRREKRRVRDELRSAQRASRARTAERLAQAAGLRQARRAAMGGVIQSLERDQHGYKELDRLGRKLRKMK